MNLKHYKTAIKSIDMAIELDPLRDKFYNTKGNFILFNYLINEKNVFLISVIASFT